jgi:hypothetical protein
MKRIIPAAFVLLASIAISQPAKAPTVADHAQTFEHHANVAALQAILAEDYPTAHFYFLGRAEAFRAAAEEVRK